MTWDAQSSSFITPSSNPMYMIYIANPATGTLLSQDWIYIWFTTSLWYTCVVSSVSLYRNDWVWSPQENVPLHGTVVHAQQIPDCLYSSRKISISSRCWTSLGASSLWDDEMRRDLSSVSFSSLLRHPLLRHRHPTMFFKAHLILPPSAPRASLANCLLVPRQVMGFGCQEFNHWLVICNGSHSPGRKRSTIGQQLQFLFYSLLESDPSKTQGKSMEKHSYFCWNLTIWSFKYHTLLFFEDSL